MEVASTRTARAGVSVAVGTGDPGTQPVHNVFHEPAMRRLLTQPAPRELAKVSVEGVT